MPNNGSTDGPQRGGGDVDVKAGFRKDKDGLRVGIVTVRATMIDPSHLENVTAIARQLCIDHLPKLGVRRNTAIESEKVEESPSPVAGESAVTVTINVHLPEPGGRQYPPPQPGRN